MANGYKHINIYSYVNDGTFQYRRIGRHILVWSVGAKPPEGPRGVIISAHGCQTPFNASFKVPANTKVYFYCPHGYSLEDPQTIRIARGEIAYNGEPYNAGETCPDYKLGKYQGKHGGKESDDYDMIGKKMHPQYLQKLVEELGIMHNDIKDIQYDIVTIRHRKVGFAPKLSEVITQLRENGYNYTEIHCAFCRSPSIKKEKGTYVAPAI
ncbi:MAG: hypothetical protein R3240_09335 [Gammaproteobacteria bacterium]|nr:hypothetical protein [Gammaproteobacteria bacterium]